MTDLADQKVCVVEVTAIEPRSVPSRWLHLDAHLLPLVGYVDRLVVHLKA